MKANDIQSGSQTSLSRVALYPWPIIQRSGLILFSLGLVFPICGILFEISLPLIVTCLSIYLLFCVVVLLGELSGLKKTISSLTFGVELPAVLYSGSEAELRISLQATSLIRDVCLLISPENCPGVFKNRYVEETWLLRTMPQAQIIHSFIPLKRGTFKFSKFRLRAFSRFALAAWQYDLMFASPIERAVYPNPLCELMGELRPWQKLSDGEKTSRIFSSEGREFECLRRYGAGEDLRRVDWKQSAHHGNLLIKVYRPETHQRINLAIDCGRRMTTTIGQREQIEYATDAAAYLARLALLNQDEVGLFAFNHAVQATLPCATGLRQEKRIAEKLRKVELGDLEADYQLLTEWAVANRKRSLLVLITSASNPAGLEDLAKVIMPLRVKHHLFVAVLSDVELIRLTQEAAESVDQAFIIASAMQSLNEIKRRVEILKREGIDCAYCAAPTLTAVLNRKYHELKRRGVL